MKRRIDQEYLAALDDLVGDEGRVYESTDAGDPSPVLVIYDGVPEDGHYIDAGSRVRSANRNASANQEH